MKKYFVNEKSQSNGDHEVHHENCSFLAFIENKKFLGEYLNCKDAVSEAKKIFPKSNGCFYCSSECHTQ